jgi:hypothetical protein
VRGFIFIEMSPEKIKTLVEHYLTMSHVHYGAKVKRIEHSIVETYDGQYPTIEVIYEDKLPEGNPSPVHNIPYDIEKYTGLKHKKDYWLGISVE